MFEPELTFPPEVAAHVRAVYAGARVILEYGSGGSTTLAAGMPGKFVMSVESDRAWATGMQIHLDAAALPSPAVIYYVDIGGTGAWGRPLGPEAWSAFHRYPLAIWNEAFFRHPDVILIDGRFRPACLATALLRITKAVVVLFDDYAKRPQYHMVERLVAPTRMVGRMAEFRLMPRTLPQGATADLIGTFAQASYAMKPARQPDIRK